MNTRESHHVLIIEGVEDRYKAQAAVLSQAGYSVQSVQPDSIEQLEELLACLKPDVVLYGKGENMPDLESVTTLLPQGSAEIPLIVMTSKRTKRGMTTAENCGAAAVVQNGSPENLLRTVKKELTSSLLQRRVGRLEHEFEVIQLQHRINELERTLREKEACCTDLTEDSRNAIAYLHEGLHIYANPSYCKLLGFGNDDEIIGTPLLNRVNLHHNEILTKLLRNPFASHDITQLRVKLERDDSEPFEADMEFSAIKYANRLCTQVTIRATDEQVIDESPPDTLRQHDMVTGLYNRQYFMKVLEDNISTCAKSGKFQAVTFILLDNFKTIREKIGITASDNLIIDIAGLIREIYGHENTIARFGDYTFTILNNYSYKEGAQQLAETLRAKVENHTMTINEHTVRTSCSIGICVINEHVKDAQNAHSRADLACELARTSGGNQIHVHSTTVDAQIDHEVEEKMDDMVRKTIDENRFYLVYQPIISLSGKAGGHYEVLLRVLDEEGRSILPGQFLSLAEKSPLIMEIDRRVIQIAFKALADKHKEEENISFFIKLSGETLADTQLPEWIDLQLKRFDLRGDSIIFEIAESVAVSRPQETRSFSAAMQTLGCKLAIEHFGYANKPEIIKYASVEYLKIDGSLINNLASNTDNQAKVRSIVDLARGTQIMCIAEHVDDAHCLVLLWQYSIDYIQGNLVKEPGKELTHDFEDEAALAGILETEEK
ncbi:MAG: EAL domain-containing protein [Gammaproteobacteria bacterium]|nr:EAL domain-containing protein [Gammaproteobacteria bacterium]